MSGYFYNPTSRKLPTKTAKTKLTKTAAASAKVSTTFTKKKNPKTLESSWRKQVNSSILKQIPVLKRNSKTKGPNRYKPSDVVKKQLRDSLKQKLKNVNPIVESQDETNSKDGDEKEINNLINITVGIYNEMDSDINENCNNNDNKVQCLSANLIEKHENIDYVLNEISEINAMLTFNNDPETIVVLVLASGENYLYSNSDILEQFVENFPLLNSKFSYYCVERDEQVANDKEQVYDLLNLKDNRRRSSTKTRNIDCKQLNCDKISKRKICSTEYIFDLVKLGNFNYMHNIHKKKKPNSDQEKQQSTTFILQFDLIDNPTTEQSNQQTSTNRKVYLVDINVDWNANNGSIKSDKFNRTLQEIENFICARQRGQYQTPTDSNLLTKLFKDSTFAPDSNFNLYFIGIVSSNNLAESIENRTQFADSLVSYLQRIKRYGTVDDDYDEFILFKNQSLIEDLKTPLKKRNPTAKHDTRSDSDIYLYLLNNVSLLEVELIETHKNFNDVMKKWFDDHKLLDQSLAIDTSTDNSGLNQAQSNKSEKCFDVDRYTGRMMELLVDQAYKIEQLIASIDNFNIGLAQLRQSVIDTGQYPINQC